MFRVGPLNGRGDRENEVSGFSLAQARYGTLDDDGYMLGTIKHDQGVAKRENPLPFGKEVYSSHSQT